jgi:hypothetical protein
MANLIKRENRDLTRSASPEHRLAPFRMMDALLRWDPFRGDLDGFSQSLDFVPHFDVKETKDAYVINAAASRSPTWLEAVRAPAPGWWCPVT